MGVTPARRARDSEKEDASRDAGRAANELKFDEFKAGCDSGQVSACASLGEWWAIMRNDHARAVELFGPACVEGGHAQACLALGRTLATGRPGVPASPTQAVRALALGCEGGNADACMDVGRLLLQQSAAATRGAGATPAPAPLQASTASASAAHYLFKGCEGGSTTVNAACCGVLAALHLSPRFGLGVGGSTPSSPPPTPTMSVASSSMPPSATVGLTPVTHSPMASASGGGPHTPLTHPPPPQRPSAATLLGWLHTACAGEHANSCFQLATVYREGGFPSVWGGADVSPTHVLSRDEAKADAFERQGLAWSGLTEVQATKAMAKRRAASAAAASASTVTAATSTVMKG